MNNPDLVLGINILAFAIMALTFAILITDDLKKIRKNKKK